MADEEPGVGGGAPVQWLPPQPEGGAPRPWAQPPYPLPPAPARPPSNDRAVLSLILGVSGLVAFFGARLGLFFVFNLPPAIAAWVIGVQAKRRVDRGETPEHRGTAKAGIVLGVVGTLLGVLAIVGWTLALTLSEDFRREVPRWL